MLTLGLSGLSSVYHKQSRFINSQKPRREIISAHLAEVGAEVLGTEFIAGEDLIYHLPQHPQLTDGEPGLWQQ